MKIRLFAAALALSAAGILGAAETQTVLTPDSTLFTVTTSEESNALQLTRRLGDTRELMAVPGTDDVAIETDPRLVYDSRNEMLFVVWHRADGNVDEILFATLNAKNEWSTPQAITTSGGRHAGLQVILTTVKGKTFEESDTTLLNVAWWTINARQSVPEFAVVAFENRKHLSTYVDNLIELANIKETEGDTEVEDTGNVEHPPLAMTRNETGVDVVFGRDQSTALTRLRIEPRRVAGNARMWRPVGKTGTTTGPARLVAVDSDPVQAFISKSGRVVLYTPTSRFRFIVYDNGKWLPIRMIELDGTVSSDELVQQLHRTVEEMASPSSTQQEE
jgi:hypothetical protein